MHPQKGLHMLVNRDSLKCQPVFQHRAKIVRSCSINVIVPKLSCRKYLGLKSFMQPAQIFQFSDSIIVFQGRSFISIAKITETILESSKNN